MIERLYIKNYLTFEEETLEFSQGLMVFTGPSGAGKSLIIKALLSLFGLAPLEAKVAEAVLDTELESEALDIDPDENIIIRGIKKEKIRFFLNDQTISKKSLQHIFQHYIAYLNPKDSNFFSSAHVLQMIDDYVQEPDFLSLKQSLAQQVKELFDLKTELSLIEENEKKREELKEFLEYEIQKIDSVAPEPGEYERLMEIKKELSKKEKITEAIQKAQLIFEYEGYVNEALELLDEESQLFDEAMNWLKEIFATALEHLEELDELDIESILERIEALSSLKRRYGSIEEALNVRKEKQKELEKIMNLEFEKEHLEQKIVQLDQSCMQLAQKISKMRKDAAKRFTEKINAYLKPLKLSNVSIRFFEKELDKTGIDKVEVTLESVPFEKISSGEYNRLRLAFMAAWSDVKSKSGVLVLDEIDANVSGEESMAVAKILKKLSKDYQIFAISHQAQLASLADKHFLVTKSDKSSVKELNENERIQEIARIISGEKITPEAIEFAKKMRKESR
ncbi:AAA family ATPase [Nitratiruptor sp. SB155-2]|uniref:AAA family ATPase n=1 Tax=Nitratiruptor sp. (strain SB155-2) TaxID=387092 RepID=UPI000158738D|nr:AAA family ATPase [Nitratiruptor sp. SB155-2]BAF69885.1 DNA repair protein RecN [Nitratiruptor sp. SB155-2]